MSDESMTRAEILRELPEVRPGSLTHFLLRAGAKPVRYEIYRGRNRARYDRSVLAELRRLVSPVGDAQA